jgi:hypothetical protein
MNATTTKYIAVSYQCKQFDEDTWHNKVAVTTDVPKWYAEASKLKDIKFLTYMEISKQEYDNINYENPTTI